MNLIKVETFARSCLFVLCFSIVLSSTATAQAQKEERKRWELITSGSSNLGDQSGRAGTAANLTGTDANFLFRLDHLVKAPDKSDGKLDMHLMFDIGVINPARAITTRTDPATSEAAEALGVAPNAPTITSTSLSHERAFTSGGQFTLNWLPKPPDNETYAVELGAVVKGHFDAFLDDQRFYEKDGITYVRLNTTSQAESGFFRGEAGVRLRITQRAGTSAPTLQDNIDDLLVVEGLVQRASALKPLSNLYGVDTSKRYVFRFMAFPGVNPTNLEVVKGTKFVIGVEVSNDLHNVGKKDVQLFYGVTADLGKLFQ